MLSPVYPCQPWWVFSREQSPNTPGLGVAQQTYTDVTGTIDPTIATGYAVAYPLGVVGIILTIVLFRYIFRINFAKENSELDDKSESKFN